MGWRGVIEGCMGGFGVQGGHWGVLGGAGVLGFSEGVTGAVVGYFGVQRGP